MGQRHAYPDILERQNMPELPERQINPEILERQSMPEPPESAQDSAMWKLIYL
jgi:hypothetical protein